MSYGKTLLIILIGTLSFGGLTFNAFAQTTGVLSGTVKSNDGPIMGATVVLKGTTIGTTTDAAGKYQLSGIKNGTYTLQISSVGFIAENQRINIGPGQPSDFHFQLKKDSRVLDDVAIQGKTKTQEVKESGFMVNAIETRKFANSSSDLNQILNRSTGVKVREQGGLGSDFNFSINGLSGKQVRFFIDGIPMESFGEGMSLNNIPANLAERIEVYKGVVPIELGADALGGAVNVITDQHTKKFLDASYSYGSFNTSRAALAGRFTEEKTGLIFNFNGFHNYSDNDYLMRNNPKYNAPVSVNENNQVVYKDVRRFHDAYRSSMAQMDVGIANKSWADLFTLGFSYNNFYKEIQTGATQNNVYGGVNRKGNFYMPSVKYKKSNFLIDGLTANITGSLSLDRSSAVDTSDYIYGWGGIIKSSSVSGEIKDIKTFYHYKNNTGLIRANFAYEIDDHQSLNLNYMYSRFSRTAVDEIKYVDNNPFDKPNRINKSIVGLAYQTNFLDKRLNTTLFAKYYGLGTLVREAVFVSNGVYSRTDSSTNGNYYGYGLASRFKITEKAGLKLSYEHAYRLQEAVELLGDGILYASNIDLKPEHSDNINIGGYYAHQQGRHKFTAEAGYFFRNVKDLIYATPGGKFSQVDNLGTAQINGVEGELGYQYNNLLEASVNASYQKGINKGKIDVLNGLPDPTYLDRIPNQPNFFANANFGIGKNDLLGKDTRLQFNWSSQFVNWYYVSWESRGSKETINKIPSQLVHNVSLSYSLQNGKYNISAESFNVTNELAYDNFRLQKPGRSVFLKLRYFIR
ncbi:TonB-dependent receptor [Pedobacter sp. AW31-3R]|uniref:TonB-dependent receptor n=1 Tax=Pedobacter sp. AW31-3R TaxID=3445781 RepID=UPI003FA163F5